MLNALLDEQTKCTTQTTKTTQHRNANETDRGRKTWLANLDRMERVNAIHTGSTCLQFL